MWGEENSEFLRISRKPISCAADGLDYALAQFFPQTVDVYRHGSAVAHGLQAPDPLVQSLPVKNHAWIAHEEQQKLILLVFQRHFLFLQKNPPGGGLFLENPCSKG